MSIFQKNQKNRNLKLEIPVSNYEKLKQAIQ